MSTPTMKELVEKATPGPWQHAGGEITDAIGAPVGNTRGRGISVEEMHYTGKFIARCNPATMAKVAEALTLASLNYKRTNHSNPEMMMDDEHEAWSAVNRALNLLNGKPTQ